MEIFKDTNIDGYEVSNYGRVRSKDKLIIANKYGGTRIRKAKDKIFCDNGKGYKFLFLYHENIKHRLYVHRLVAIAFLDNPYNKPTVNHKDGNKSNNTVENLEWATYKENNAHAVETGLNILTGGSLPVIQKTKQGEVIAEYKSSSEAARITGICRSSIQGCCKPHRKGQKTAGGFIWVFK